MPCIVTALTLNMCVRVCALHLFIRMCVGAHVCMQSSCVEIRPQLVRIDSLFHHVDLGVQTYAIRLGDENPNY